MDCNVLNLSKLNKYSEIRYFENYIYSKFCINFFHNWEYILKPQR